MKIQRFNHEPFAKPGLTYLTNKHKHKTTTKHKKMPSKTMKVVICGLASLGSVVTALLFTTSVAVMANDNNNNDQVVDNPGTDGDALSTAISVQEVANKAVEAAANVANAANTVAKAASRIADGANKDARVAMRVANAANKSLEAAKLFAESTTSVVQSIHDYRNGAEEEPGVVAPSSFVEVCDYVVFVCNAVVCVAVFVLRWLVRRLLLVLRRNLELLLRLRLLLRFVFYCN